MVVDSSGDYDEAFDAEDNSLHNHEVVDAIIQNMLYEKQDTGALEAYRYLDNSEWSDPLLDKDAHRAPRDMRGRGEVLLNNNMCCGRADPTNAVEVVEPV